MLHGWSCVTPADGRSPAAPDEWLAPPPACPDPLIIGAAMTHRRWSMAALSHLSCEADVIDCARLPARHRPHSHLRMRCEESRWGAGVNKMCVAQKPSAQIFLGGGAGVFWGWRGFPAGQKCGIKGHDWHWWTCGCNTHAMTLLPRGRYRSHWLRHRRQRSSVPDCITEWFTDSGGRRLPGWLVWTSLSVIRQLHHRIIKLFLSSSWKKSCCSSLLIVHCFSGHCVNTFVVIFTSVLLSFSISSLTSMPILTFDPWWLLIKDFSAPEQPLAGYFFSLLSLMEKRLIFTFITNCRHIDNLVYCLEPGAPCKYTKDHSGSADPWLRNPALVYNPCL